MQPAKPKKAASERLRELWPDIRELVLPRRGLLVAGFFLTGVAIPVYDINQFSVRQAVIPLDMQGRGNATMRTIIRGAVPLGAVIGGFLAEQIGLRGVMVFAAFGGVAAFLAIWFSPVRALQILPSRVPVLAA